MFLAYRTAFALLAGVLMTACRGTPQKPQRQTTLSPVAETSAVRIARDFMQTQPDAPEVLLDSLQVRHDSVEWQVYFFRRAPRVPPFELVAVNQASGMPRRVPLR